MEYTLTITEVRTYDTDQLKNIIKEVDWILEAKQNDVSYNVTTTSKLDDPSLVQDFISFNDITESELKNWVEQTSEYKATEAHVTEVVNKRLETASLTPKMLPWMSQASNTSLLVGELPPIPTNIAG